MSTSSMGLQGEIFLKTTHLTGGTTSCKLKELEVPRNNAQIPRGGDFIQAGGNHMKLSQGLPFVLAVNGGEILLHILEEFNVQLRQESFPVIVYVEPGPNVSTLGAGASFTLFICGSLFLVQVLRVLRQPDTKDAVRIDLLAPSLGDGAVGPESENARVAPCHGSNRLPSPETLCHRPRTPESPVKTRYSENPRTSSSSAQIPDCTLGESSLLMQMPIPSRAINPELLSTTYGWLRTTSPLPLMDAEQEYSISSRRFTPRTETAGKNLVCPLRTPDTPSQIRTDSLTAQHGSLLSHDTASIADKRIPKDHCKVDGVEPSVGPSSVLLPFGSGKNVVDCPISEARLARIIGSTFSRLPEPPERYSSWKPELDPKVSVVDDHATGVCHSPFPAPIGTGRPHAPIDQFPFSRDGGSSWGFWHPTGLSSVSHFQRCILDQDGLLALSLHYGNGRSSCDARQ